MWFKKSQKINVWPLPTILLRALRNVSFTDNPVVFFIETCIHYFRTFFQKKRMMLEINFNLITPIFLKS